MQRRDFLKLASVLTALPLSGCCAYSRWFPLVEDREGFAQPFEEFTPYSGTKNRHKIRYAIDTHTHFFNATDMQTSGYLLGPIANSSHVKNLKKIIIALAPIVDMLAHASVLSARSEYAVLKDRYRNKSKIAGMDLVRPYIKPHEKEIIDELYRELNKDNLKTRVLKEEIHKVMARENPRSIVYLKGGPSEKVFFPKEFFEDVFWGGNSHIKISERSRQEQSISGIFYFVGRMLSYRHINIARYKEAYSSPNSFGINACFGALVNFDYFLGDDSACSPLHDQILLNKKLAELYSGYYFPMVAYNPWTDCEGNDESLSLVETAIKKHGFKGIKIYPSIGFYPYGNKGDDYCDLIKQPKQPPITCSLDNKLSKLYDLASSLKVPVLGHSGTGMGQTSCTAKYGGAKGWKKLVSHLESSKKSSKIIFGHFGGENESPGFSSLIKNDNSKLKLYGDLGYWEEMARQDGQDIAEYLVSALGSGNKKSFDRLLYGSDWLMLSQLKRTEWTNYPAILFKNISKALEEYKYSETRIEEILNKISYKNALEAFNMKVCEKDGKGVFLSSNGIEQVGR